MRKILIIDDEPDVIEVTLFRLKKSGFEVMTRNNGIAGLECIRAERPDLVILDLNMPGMSGQEVFREIKADTAIAAIPVMIFSAGERLEKVKEELGDVSDCLAKPFDFPEMLAKVIKITGAV